MEPGQEGIGTVQTGLAGERAVGDPCHVDIVRMDRHGSRVLILGRAELVHPANVPRPVQLNHERVVET